MNIKYKRNWFDVFSIILITACAVTHIVDVLNHSEELSRDHARLLAVTVIVIAIRLLKVIRLLFEVN